MTQLVAFEWLVRSPAKPKHVFSCPAPFHSSSQHSPSRWWGQLLSDVTAGDCSVPVHEHASINRQLARRPAVARFYVEQLTRLSRVSRQPNAHPKLAMTTNEAGLILR
jgi:hypothetical protein